MPKDQPKPSTVRIAVSFPDPEILKAVDIAAKAEAGSGEPENRSRWIRDAIRERLRRQGFKKFA